MPEQIFFHLNKGDLGNQTRAASSASERFYPLHHCRSGRLFNSYIFWAPLRVHVSQADGRLLLWMYTLQVSLELVTNNKIVAAPSPCRLVATNWGAIWSSNVSNPPFNLKFRHLSLIWRSRVRFPAAP